MNQRRHNPMNKFQTGVYPSRKALMSFSCIILFSILSTVSVFAQGVTIDKAQIAAQRTESEIILTVPIANDTGAQVFSDLSATLMDAEYRPLSLVNKKVVILNGKLDETIAFPVSASTPDIEQCMVRIDFAGKTWLKRFQQTAPDQDIHIIGQTEWIAGSIASLRIIATQSVGSAPIKDAKVRIFAEKENEDRITLAKGTTDESGSLSLHFQVPEKLTGTANLAVQVDSNLGEDRIESKINVISSSKVLLTTDKPVYQPGQLIHIRALSVHKTSDAPLVGREITLEVYDGKGNKVFKQNEVTSEFGIAAADFQLADEVNQGDYLIKALLGDDTSEKTVQIYEYVLPKFRVDVQSEKTFYAPGDTVKGSVSARYFFGKPVDGAKVTVTANCFDVGFNEFATVEKTSDAEGRIEYEFVIPDRLVGQPSFQGNTIAQLDVRVLDTADHEEQKIHTFHVATNPVEIEVIPESGMLVEGVPNEIFVVASRPDGGVAEPKLTITSPMMKTPVKLQCDDNGIASFIYMPDKIATATSNSIQPDLSISAEIDGKTVEIQTNLPVGSELERILLRPNKGVYQVGETLNAMVYSSFADQTPVFLDIVKDKQTALTHTLRLEGGKASIDIPIDNTLAGSLALNAYIVRSDGNMIRDTRQVVATRSDDLDIAITLDKIEYQPGEPATIQIAVKDASGEPVRSALGMNIVDESVYSLSEKEPGLAKVFFALERELLDPKIEIHGHQIEEVVLLSGKNYGKNAKLSRALMSKVDSLSTFALNINSAETKKQQASQDLQSVQNWFAPKSFAVGPEPKPVDEAALALQGDPAEFPSVDPWGHPYQVYVKSQAVAFASLGRDGEFGTPDDIELLNPSYAFDGFAGNAQTWTISGATFVIIDDAGNQPVANFARPAAKPNDKELQVITAWFGKLPDNAQQPMTDLYWYDVEAKQETREVLARPNLRFRELGRERGIRRNVGFNIDERNKDNLVRFKGLDLAEQQVRLQVDNDGALEEGVVLFDANQDLQLGFGMGMAGGMGMAAGMDDAGVELEQDENFRFAGDVEQLQALGYASPGELPALGIEVGDAVAANVDFLKTDLSLNDSLDSTKLSGELELYPFGTKPLVANGVLNTKEVLKEFNETIKNDPAKKDAALESLKQSFIENELMTAEQKQELAQLIQQLDGQSLDGQSLDDIAMPAKQPQKRAVRVRRYFPETLYYTPELITDNHGEVALKLPLADSITTWRMSAMANAKSGAIGDNTSALKVFKPFFADLDLPVSLIQDDVVTIPVAVYNYRPEPQSVRVELQKSGWFELLEGGFERTIDISANEVASVTYRIEAKQLGKHPITVYAWGSDDQDAIGRDIDVRPNGVAQYINHNGRLNGPVSETLDFPTGRIEGADQLFVKIYPGFFSQIVEGLDSIMRMPNGCFEQTSSTTYPNLLALKYMQDTGRITPAIEMKAREYINLGYQRLLTFEIDGGGFEVFGNPAATRILSAYGLLEFMDMSQVYPVDENVIARTKNWLLGQMNGDGTWDADQNYAHAEMWGSIQNNKLLVTSYIALALAKAKAGNALQTAKEYLLSHADEAKDAYTLSILCNALLALDPSHAATKRCVARLVEMGDLEGDNLFWTSEASMSFARGNHANVETTAWAAIALIEDGRFRQEIGKALNWIIEQKDPQGTWGTTHGTVLALKALILSLGQRTEEIDGSIKILVNGEAADALSITPENSDVFRQVDLTGFLKEGGNKVELSVDGEGSLLYQVVGKYFKPWGDEKETGKAFDIAVEYDRTELRRNDTVTCKVAAKNLRPQRAEMVMIDIGVPPGFRVETPAMDEYVNQGAIKKYTIMSRQLLIYLEAMDGDQELKLDVPMKATLPMVAKAPESEIYEYYNPEVRKRSKPQELKVE